MERRMKIMKWVEVFLCIRESYQKLEGLILLVIECHIIVLNIHAPTEDKTEEQLLRGTGTCV
jgi:hypothetical protein